MNVKFVLRVVAGILVIMPPLFLMVFLVYISWPGVPILLGIIIGMWFLIYSPIIALRLIGDAIQGKDD